MTKAEEVVFYAKLLDEKGLVNSLEGNISVLDRTEGKLYITPSGKRKSLLTPDMIAVMRGDEQVGGSCRRSSEYLLHRAALDARPDCSAAVHVHAPYLTAYAFCSRSIRLRCSTTFGLLFEDIPCLPYGQPGTPAITDGIEEAIAHRDLLLLANHGCIAVGATLEEAVALIEAGEEVMKIYALARAAGEVSDIPPADWERMCEEHPGSVRNRHRKA